MILQCPSCYSRFAVPDALIPSEGREVRCGKCAHQWHAERVQPIPMEGFDALVAREMEPAGEPASVSPAEPTEAVASSEQATPEITEPFASPAHPLPAVRRRRVWPLLPFRIATACLLVAWLIIAIFAYFPTAQYRHALRGFYSMFGASDTRGLAFENVTMERQQEGARTRFVLSGAIANRAPELRTIPTVRVLLKDDQNGVVWSRDYAVEQVVKSGEQYPFRIDDVETAFASRAASITLDVGNGLELMMR